MASLSKIRWAPMTVLVVAIALLAVPLASAQIGGFGYRVTTEDGTTRFDLNTGGPNTLVLLDDDGDGSPDPGEAIWVSASTTQIQANDVRLSGPYGAAGSQVQTGDDDVGLTVEQVPGQLSFHDSDGDGEFERGESLYWDEDTTTGTVTSRDIALNGADAGEAVGSSDPHLNQDLDNIAGPFRYYDVDGNGAYSAGDRVYIDVRGDGYVGPPDIRIGQPGAYAMGTMPQPGDTDSSLRLISNDAPTEFVYVDDGGDGTFTGDQDPAFLATSSNTVFAGSIRLANPLMGEPGSVVGGGDPDSGLTASTFSGDLAYSGSSDSTMDDEDVLYFDRSGAGTTDRADGNDLILSGPDAGMRVGDTTTHEGASITSAPGSIKYVDANGDGSYQVGDLVYLDADSDGFVSPADVQFTYHQPADQPEPTPTDADGDGVPDSEDACPDQPADTSDGCPAETDGGDGGTSDGGDSESDLQQAREAQQAALDAQESAREALQAAQEAKEISEQNQELIGQVLEKLNETGQNGSPGPGLVIAMVGMAGAAMLLRTRREP